ncbi:membrane hypothetical protein [metagenome]|uniref:Cadmium resistance transporter n=1 Tax=metagenome TaxID=256318 RepID=A0A2P2BX16_9ZZZZ
MLTTIATAIGLFVATNLDDVVVLTSLFVASTRGGIRGRSVVAGQYIGFIALVGLSAIAALGLTIVPVEWVGLLGLIPMAIGVHALIRTLRHGGGDDAAESALRAGGLLGVAGITFANGGDNIAIYTRFSAPCQVRKPPPPSSSFWYWWRSGAASAASSEPITPSWRAWRSSRAGSSRLSSSDSASTS